MVFTLVGLLLIVYSFINFKKSFLFLLIFKLFLVTNITVVAIPGLPLFTLDLFLTMVFFLQFWRYRKKISHKVDFPYKKPMIFLFVSWTISTVFAYVGFVGAVSQLVQTVFKEILFIWMLWELFDVERDLNFLIKWLTIAFFFICLYGLYEHQIQANPLVEYESSLIGDSERAIVWTYGADSGRGYRVQSVFEHAIGAGINWALYVILILSLMINYRYPIRNKFLCLITALLSILCLIYTNSRGPIVFLLLAGFSLINLKNRRTYILLTCGVIGIALLWPYLSEYMNNVLSLFSHEAQRKVGGSSIEMRFDQLAAALSLMSQSPIFGFGFKFMNELHNSLTAALLGLESMWLSIIVQFGLLGIIANIYFAYYCLIRIPKFFHSKSVFYLSLAYWVTASLTSVPGMLYYLYFLILIVFIKLSPTYQKLSNSYGK